MKSSIFSGSGGGGGSDEDEGGRAAECRSGSRAGDRRAETEREGDGGMGEGTGSVVGLSRLARSVSLTEMCILHTHTQTNGMHMRGYSPMRTQLWLHVLTRRQRLRTERNNFIISLFPKLR